MKKFQLQITVEQKESWRITQNGDVKVLPAWTVIEIASSRQVESQGKKPQTFYRRVLFFRSYSDWLYRFFKIFRRSEQKEKIAGKQIEK